jgi:hypothetical protein
MSLLKPAKNSSAYLKAGILGFGGSGKTYTATEVAIGLCQHTKGTKTAFFDTETGSDYMIPRFSGAGIELLVHKGRAFKDLVDIVKECEDGGVSVLIIDSISHVWRELQDSYKRRVKRNNLYMQDWGILKGQWSEFTDAYLNSKLHIIMLGRAGYEYEHEENEATGKKEMIKVGTKMKVEGEMAYEPSLLIEMEAMKNPSKKGFIHRATILKDRSDLMNGKQIDNPRFQDFLPIVNFLNIGGEHVGIDTSRSSEELFESPDRSYEEKKRKHAIAIETLQEVLVLNGLDGTSKEAKENRTKLLIQFFGSSSKTYIEEKLSLFDLQMGIEKLKSNFKPAVEPTQESFTAITVNVVPASINPDGVITVPSVVKPEPVKNKFDEMREKYVKQ